MALSVLGLQKEVPDQLIRASRRSRSLDWGYEAKAMNEQVALESNLGECCFRLFVIRVATQLHPLPESSTQHWPDADGLGVSS